MNEWGSIIPNAYQDLGGLNSFTWFYRFLKKECHIDGILSMFVPKCETSTWAYLGNKDVPAKF